MKAKNPYRPGTKQYVIAREGARTFYPSRSALASKIARMCRCSVKVAEFAVNVVANAKQRSNRGTTEIKVNGVRRIKYLTPAEHAALKTRPEQPAAA